MSLLDLVYSIAPAAVMSIVAFFIGLRTSKEKSDRERAREIYRRLFVHFNELEKSIEVGAPRFRHEFESLGQLSTVTRKFERSGDIFLIPKTLRKNLTYIEDSYFEIEDKFMEPIMNQHIPYLRLIIENRLPNEPKSPNFKADRRILRLGNVLVNSDEIEKILSEINRKEDVILEIEFSPYTIGPYNIRIQKRELAEIGRNFYDILVPMKEYLDSNSDINEYSRSVRRLQSDIKYVNKILSQKVVEPFPFRETLFRIPREF